MKLSIFLLSLCIHKVNSFDIFSIFFPKTTEDLNQSVNEDCPQFAARVISNLTTDEISLFDPSYNGKCAWLKVPKYVFLVLVLLRPKYVWLLLQANKIYRHRTCNKCSQLQYTHCFTTFNGIVQWIRAIGSFSIRERSGWLFWLR